MSGSITYGALATVGLLALYGLTMTALGGFDAAVAQFRALWYLMLPLAIGFGIQIGLYVKLKEAMKHRAKAALTAAGTSASVGMLACCAHHATEVLPFLGLSVVSIFLAQYQVPILGASLAINAVGIFVMASHVRKIRT
jgi:Cu+-exporting ATPase